MLELIIGLSMVMWYIIDRFKGLWTEKSFGKYITMAVSAVFGFGLAFGFGLDLIVGLGLVESITAIGQVLTGFALMGGSSAVAEIVGKIKGGSSTSTE